MPKKARKTSWGKCKPMPKENIVITFHHEFSHNDYEKLQYGIVPQEMEDKWFIYFEDDKLYCYRSWTGYCIYIVDFQGSSINKVTINRDREQHTETDNDWDCQFVVYLINLLLLHKQSPYPREKDIDSDTAPIRQWNQMGRAMFGDHDFEIVKSSCRNNRKLIQGKVDLRFDHIKLYFDEDKDPVAIVTAKSNNSFTYLILRKDDSEVVNSVVKELNYYLIELNEENPWAYARYHCTTAANIYSKVHWSYCEGQG